MFYCPCCGKEIIWQSDFDAEDVFDSEEPGIVSFYYCNECDLLLETYFDDKGCNYIRIQNFE